ncbi:MAG TPA: cytochrome c oxidase subunit 3 family protein [Bryobacteraceae bacterium]|nr:cytochrome c oxidase subunit 3 family protein [Bryobacteraceae bacterium]
MSDLSSTVHTSHEEHAPGLQHHFTTMKQQFEAAKIGMWLFLVTEVLLFGGLFVGYGIMHAKHPEAFVAAHHHLDWRLGAVNTIVLLMSSFTMVMGVWSAQTGQKKKLIAFLLLTVVLAMVFMGIKYVEYSHKFHEGLLPGKYYSHQGDTVPGQFMFFSFYFMMTGLHGIHVLLGVAAILWVMFRAMRNEFSAQYYGPVDIVGLYWHLVDLIWIYLFPLMYLIS